MIMLITINRRLRALRERNDDGLAMILVVGVGSVLAILVVAAIAFSIGGLKQSRTSASWNAALAAAYAGVEEYQSRLASDPTYYKYGNPASNFGDAPSMLLPVGGQANAAFGVGATGSWAQVPGSAGDSWFRYEVDNTKYNTDGTLRIRSTGKVGNETRSIVADLKQRGFLDYLYFTDFEIQDPQLSKAPADCIGKYAHTGRPATGCSEIAFGAKDTLYGPVHSNDTIRGCSAVFKDAVTSANNPPAGENFLSRDSNNNGCTRPTFELALEGYPKFAAYMGLPASNSLLKKETRFDLPEEVPQPGCLFTGPTRITFKSNGDMNVYSPWTKATQTTGANGARTPAACGVINQLGNSAGSNFVVPKDNVVYVQNVPATAGDPNYWAATATPSGLACTGADGSVAGNGIGYPFAGEVVPAGDPYGCRNGDLFVSGTVDGNVTVGAENFVYVTGDIIREDPQTDMLGIIAENSVFVFNPVKGSGSDDNLINDWNRRIDAAIMAVDHTFQVQNYAKGGARGELTVNGAIIQKYRGIVQGTVGGQVNGYTKAYRYDSRMKYTAPPKFLSPINTTYAVNIWVEVSPIFDETGGYRA